jgi:triosephosphate isomerase
VWAIGTGEVATPRQVEKAHAFIRKWVAEHFSDTIAAAMRILYGGSVKPDNIRELMRTAGVDGVLVGGASLKADTFLPIIEYDK